MEKSLGELDSRLFNALSRCSPSIFFFYSDMASGYVHFSESASKYFGFPEDMPFSAEWSERVHPDEYENTVKSIRETMRGDKPTCNSEYRIKNAKGEYQWVNCRGYMTYGEDGKPDFFAGYLRNMGQVAKIDAVTGMRNSYVFRTDLTRLLEEGAQGAAMYIEVRNFKRINAKYGYDFGNTALYTIGKAITAACGDLALAYRINGTEFAVIAEGMGRDDMVSLYNRIAAMLGDIRVNGQSLRFDISSGATLFPQDGVYFDSINSNLTYAHTTARSRLARDVVFYSNELYEKRNRIARITEAMQCSIENDFDGFYVVFQPVMDSATGKLHSAEALLRWKNSDFPDTGPVEFVPILEQTEKIIPVGRWIIDKAFYYVSEWNKSNSKNKLRHVNINFSYVQFSDEGLKDYIIAELDKYNLPHDTLVAELTESCRIEYTDKLAKILQTFRDEGITIALDDFGTGYASLMLLKDTPTDIIKLDHTMTRTIQNKPKDRILVEFIIKYCKEMHIETCAEGVENDEICKIVSDAGASLLQGYYYSKPIEADEFFEKYLK